MATLMDVNAMIEKRFQKKGRISGSRTLTYSLQKTFLVEKKIGSLGVAEAADVNSPAILAKTTLRKTALEKLTMISRLCNCIATCSTANRLKRAKAITATTAQMPAPVSHAGRRMLPKAVSITALPLLTRGLVVVGAPAVGVVGLVLAALEGAEVTRVVLHGVA
jgi:hypothetical protein